MTAKSLDIIFSSFSNVMELLRDKQFQYLLENYERAKKVFIVGYEVKDDITSEVLFSVGEKSDLKPEDYLNAFSDFIRTKSNEIEALQIILNKPRQWNTKVLNEIKSILSKNDFEEEKIRKAHKLIYHKDLVDIISMIKHAYNAQEQLLEINERVDNAIQIVLRGKTLSYDQLQWINYIKDHLKQNLTIDQKDFETQPIFEQKGGWSKFKRLFKDNYTELLIEINEAIAA